MIWDEVGGERRRYKRIVYVGSACNRQNRGERVGGVILMC